MVNIIPSGMPFIQANWLKFGRPVGTPKTEPMQSGLSRSGSLDTHNSRVVHLGKHASNEPFASNAIKTSKYNVATFLPKFLFQIFSRVAYLYFLLQAALAYWTVVSPFSPIGPTLALLFVLGVAAVKAIVEDSKRHIEDSRTNRGIAHCVNADGSVSDLQWQDVKVGMVIKVLDDEDIPADIMLLQCPNAANVCFIKTTNLDGESNLKIRKPVDLKAVAPQDAAEAVALNGTLNCERPNPSLHTFVGKFAVVNSSTGALETAVAVTMNEVLLRGCTLKNSGFAVGLVVYTGPESRIQMNANEPPHKVGSYDAFLNGQITLVIILQLSICALLAMASVFWRESSGVARYHLALTSNSQGNYPNTGVDFLILFLTMWILLSYMVPISLFVTLEIVKFIQAFIFINHDKDMYDPASGEWSKARNSDIVEDLGKAEYVFSDKTGTLTSNEMRLRLVAIKGRPFGNVDFKLEDVPKTEDWHATLTGFDERLATAAQTLMTQGFWEHGLAAGGSHVKVMRLARASGVVEEQLHGTNLEQALNSVASGEPSEGALGAEMSETSLNEAQNRRQLVLGHHVLDFWTNICICQSLLVEEGLGVYQGPSPDEVALVEGARQLGFEYVSKSDRSITISMMGHTVTHELLNTLDFTSERARMSVIARAPDGTIRLHTKGSDAVMLGLLRKGMDEKLLSDTLNNLQEFSVQGLRTLVVGSRVVPEEDWVAWNERYQAAASLLNDRDAQVESVAQEIERDLELLGVTAIEDKLQDGVPEAIKTLINAGIKVWMITGDKQETAINIAVSCKLFNNASEAMLCNAPSGFEAAQARLQVLQALVHEQESKGVKGHELVVDGKTLSHILGSDLEQELASLAKQCSGVVICRSSPSQKAAVLRIMMNYEYSLAEGHGPWIIRRIRRYKRRLQGKSVAIGDGANDVAMIQAADIGVGLIGKEGRQAVNNSDFAVPQFRFLVRLLLVHGSLSTYRLARLIKYSFYKNICFAAMLFCFQFFNGYSGQALVDGITAAFYNAVFTALPVATFAVVDRPTRSLNTLIEIPQMYNRGRPLTARSFWKTGVLLGLVHGAICFFVPFLSLAASDNKTSDGLFSIGKTAFIAVLGVVSLEIALVSRYWTKIWVVFWVLSYALVYPFMFLFYVFITNIFSNYDPAQVGVAFYLTGSWKFWFELLLIYCVTFGMRYLERCIKWVFFPTDSMIAAEISKKQWLDGRAALKSPAPQLIKVGSPSSSPQKPTGARVRTGSENGV